MSTLVYVRWTQYSWVPIQLVRVPLTFMGGFLNCEHWLLYLRICMCICICVFACLTPQNIVIGVLVHPGHSKNISHVWSVATFYFLTKKLKYGGGGQIPISNQSPHIFEHHTFPLSRKQNQNYKLARSQESWLYWQKPSERRVGISWLFFERPVGCDYQSEEQLQMGPTLDTQPRGEMLLNQKWERGVAGRNSEQQLQIRTR